MKRSSWCRDRLPDRLVAPVGDLDGRAWLRVDVRGVDLDDPDLVGPSVNELANGRILREQAVPIGSAVDVDRAEQRRDRRRGQDRLHRNLLAAAVERLEVAGETSTAPIRSIGARSAS